MDREELKAHLYALADGETMPASPVHGLCVELKVITITPDLCNKVHQIMSHWPEHSGDYEYPVPHPSMSPDRAYQFGRNLWANDAYGNKRRDLCRFIAENL